jgi:hypothetical protein
MFPSTNKKRRAPSRKFTVSVSYFLLVFQSNLVPESGRFREDETIRLGQHRKAEDHTGDQRRSWHRMELCRIPTSEQAKYLDAGILDLLAD